MVNVDQHLVGGFNPSEKYEVVKWDDDIPKIWKNKSHVPNHQPDSGSDYGFLCASNLPKATQHFRGQLADLGCSVAKLDNKLPVISAGITPIINVTSQLRSMFMSFALWHGCREQTVTLSN